MDTKNIAFISALETIIQERLENPAAGSYTAELAAAGIQRIAQKVGEEGVELALAAVSGNRDDIVNEAADLLYHVIVLLAHQSLSIEDVAARLESRH